MDLATLGIRITTQGAKEATRDLAGLEKQAAASEKRAVSIGKAWGLALGTAVVGAVGVGVGALKTYIQNSIEAEKVQAQLNATLKSTGFAAELSAGEINKMAEALQDVTVFDDEAITGAQSLLLTFTKIGRDVFPRATEAVLDMSTALGTDLRSAALQIGKALNDPVKGITALSRAGVQFSKEQTEVIKSLVETGRVAEAQRIILAELETQMGGSAKAARNTLGGALQSLKNSFDNLLEGDTSQGGLLGARKAVEDLNKTLNDPEIKRGVDTIASALFRLAEFAANASAKVSQAAQMMGATLAAVVQSAQASYQIVSNLNIGGLITGDLSAGLKAAKKSRDDFLAYTESLIEARKKAAAELAKDFVPGRLTRKPGEGQFANVLGTEDGVPRRPSAGGGGSGEDEKKKGRARKMPDFAKEDAEELRRLIEATAQADETFQSLAATLSGPLAEAEFGHKQNLKEIDEVGRVAGRTSAEIDALKQQEIARWNEEAAAIQARLDPGKQLLDDLKFELSLMGMTNAERETAIQLRYLEGQATAEQAAEIGRLNQVMEQNREKIGLMDDIRGSLGSGLSDLARDFGNAGDIIKNTLDDIGAALTDFTARKLIEQAFGEMGTTGAGSAGGGWLNSLVSTISGAWAGGGFGFASGGFTGSGAKHEVAGVVHKGEYVLNADATRNLGRSYLDRLNAGAAPAESGRGTYSPVLNQTFVVQGTPDNRTREMMARTAASEGMRGVARTGRR